MQELFPLIFQLKYYIYESISYLWISEVKDNGSFQIAIKQLISNIYFSSLFQVRNLATRFRYIFQQLVSDIYFSSSFLKYIYFSSSGRGTFILSHYLFVCLPVCTLLSLYVCLLTTMFVVCLLTCVLLPLYICLPDCILLSLNDCLILLPIYVYLLLLTPTFSVSLSAYLHTLYNYVHLTAYPDLFMCFFVSACLHTPIFVCSLNAY